VPLGVRGGVSEFAGCPADPAAMPADGVVLVVSSAAGGQCGDVVTGAFQAGVRPLVVFIELC
jgi:hypothetical protein